jgi:hypothetical protein
VAGELCVCFEAADRADLGEQLRGGDGAATRQLEQRRRNCGRPLFEFLVELGDLPAQRATAVDKLTGDPHLHVLLPARQPAADTLELTGPVESAQRDDQGRVELVQVPAQPLLDPAPLVDEIITMVDQQLDLAMHPLTGLRARQVRLAQRRPGNSERVDRVRLPAHPAGAAFRHRQLRRDPH